MKKESSIAAISIGFVLFVIAVIFQVSCSTVAETSKSQLTEDDTVELQRIDSYSFESYKGQYLLSDEFEEEYVLSLVSNDYDSSLYYPVPSFAPKYVLTYWKDKFKRWKEADYIEAFNKSVYLHFYYIRYEFDLDTYRRDDSDIPYEDDEQAFNDARKFWIYWNIHHEMEEVDFPISSKSSSSSAVVDGDSDDSSYWEEQLDEQQERAKIDAGIIDFSVFY